VGFVVAIVNFDVAITLAVNTASHVTNADITAPDASSGLR